MIKYVNLKNFKSYKEINIDFINKKKQPKDLICIYGENGAGKSNLASAFSVLKQFTESRRFDYHFNNVIETFTEDEKASEDIISMLKKSYKDVEKIISDVKMIDSTENMVLEFGIQLDWGEGSYYIETDDRKIVKEKLIFTLNQRKGVFFDINEQNLKGMKLNESIFKDVSYRNEIKENILKYWGKHSLLSILLFELDEKNFEYFTENIDLKLINILFFISTLGISFNYGKNRKKISMGYSHKIFENIESGKINVSELKKLEAVEEFIREIFISLYSDIKDIYYKVNLKGNKAEYRLIFKKIIGEKIIDIDYSKESTGTLQILNILPFFFAATQGYTVILDEIDSGIHDLLFKEIMESLKYSITGQLIITTHNTYIMESILSDENIYLIDVDEVGNKVIRSVEQYDFRNRKNNNIRLRYLRGLYGGTPNANDIDFTYISNDLEEVLNNDLDVVKGGSDED